MMDLEKQMTAAISFVPGLMGLSNLDFSKKATVLKESNWNNGISLEESNKGLVVKVAAIISSEVRAKVLSDEISESIKDIFKKNKQKLDRVIVYIRGVK